MVGKNNVGKTNVLRAIYLFFNPDTYNAVIDRNMIKQITGGQSDDPKISLKVKDDEICKGKQVLYTLTCDLNNKEKKYYTSFSNDDTVKEKFKTSNDIKKYLTKKIKCVYLSTTDEDIDKQSESLTNELILEYYKKQNKEVKKSVEDFERQYKGLITTFQDNIAGIEQDLAKQFTGMTDSGVVPVLSINSTKDITKFLLENVKLQLDDSYAQDISTKGAGIQRASLIMLTIYLLCQICLKENKIILLDEPEAFLYPLLESKIKDKLEKTVSENMNMQMFLTSHSRGYLSEINNPDYSFAYLRQEKEKREYNRSRNDSDINKYSVVEPLNRKNKYEVLKNYGLLDQIDDYEYVIVCEGETDKNYISKILVDKEDIPQIRYNKYSVSAHGVNADLDYDYVGKGARACLPILAYLDKISEISRKVFVLLDGDKEGQDVQKKIKPNEYKHLEIEVLRLDGNKEIEDFVFDKEVFIERVLQFTPSLKPYAKQYRSVIMGMDDKVSLIEQTEQFIKGNGIKDANIYAIKSRISQDLDDVNVNGDWLLSRVNPFFYS